MWNAVRLMVSATSSKGRPLTLSSATLTTPGPLTPTLTAQSPSPGPWNAPAMNGLSSTALQNTTSFAQPRQPRSAVASAVCFTTSPISRTASMLMPARVEPTLTEEHRKSVSLSASGMDSIRRRSAAVMPLCTSAE